MMCFCFFSSFYFGPLEYKVIANHAIVEEYTMEENEGVFFEGSGRVGKSTVSLLDYSETIWVRA